MPEPGIFVAQATWREVFEGLRRGAWAILPVGAECKQHGLHLPMNADHLQAQWLAQALVERLRVVVWPTVGYGHYPAFIDYPGSCNLSASTFCAMLVEILVGIQRAGASRILVLNTGISTIAPLRRAIAQFGASRALRLCNVYQGARFLAAEAALIEQPRGGHADETETSIMLRIAPDKVDMAQARPCVGSAITGRFNRQDPHGPNFSPSGVYGDPTLASVAKGERLLDAMLLDLLETLGTPAQCP